MNLKNLAQGALLFGMMAIASVVGNTISGSLASVRRKKRNDDFSDPVVESPSGVSYEVLGKLGGGNFGSVFKCRRSTDGKELTIKVITISPGEGSDRACRRAKSEYDNLRLLDGEQNIPRAYEFWTKSFEGFSRCFILMDLVQGASLKSVLEKSCLMSEESIAPYIYQLARTLTFCCDKGVTHNDVAVQNVIVDGESVGLVDFGLSVNLNGVTSCVVPGMAFPLRCAPEIRRARLYHRNGDSWALGILILELLGFGSTVINGFLNGDRSKISDLLEQIRVSDELYELLERLLHPNPEFRIPLSAVGNEAWFKKMGIY